ncbi:MAG: hypothetical protein JXD22_11495 [Sedimentisphaerales bacterium]|nr:hypothetical protein [Sedimentisphaerales bacterium]
MTRLLDLAEQVELEVRQVALGGEGGGLCVLRGKNILFVDTMADAEEQIATTAQALAGLEKIDDMYVLPQIREILDKHRG